MRAYVESTKEYYKKYEPYMPVAFFVGGFLFDMLTLTRIDDTLTIIQQAVYLVICGAFITIEILELTREVKPPWGLGKVWHYREEVLHFILGSLLSAYAIFYFKSASAFTSLGFILFLVVLLLLNEFRRFGESRALVHFVFLSLSLISFLISLTPILIGFIGIIPFMASNVVAFVVFFAYFQWIKPKLASHPKILRSHIVIPYFSVQLIFVILYFTQVIPPVPLSVNYLGIYHDVKKKDGNYELTYFRPGWKFWQHGDQTFEARPGDVIHSFVQVFSPGGFKDQLQMHWYYKDQRLGWQSAGANVMAITGGRDEGFRYPGRKENYSPGDWRVQIETMDGREVGRLNFTIIKDESVEAREPSIDVH
jgi:hypothetical protein